MKLADDWWLILKHAWSVRLLALAAVLSGAEVALPLVADFVPMQYRIVFALLIFFVIIGAFASRIVAQKELQG